MNTLRYFLHIVVIIVSTTLLTACFGDIKPAPMPVPETTHTLIALDLSDRIHNNPQTVDKDILVVKQLFAQFQQQAQQAMYVDYMSSFTVVRIPQRGDEELSPFLDSLSIDLGQVDDLQKCDAVENFAAKLDARLRSLYSKASKPSLKDYDGACVFRFLNHSLPAWLNIYQGDKTHLYIISDGLIEVDSPQARLEINGRHNYITEAQLSKLRKGNAWQHSDLHLLVVPESLANRDNSHLAITLIGLQPRADYALEHDMLKTIWRNWMAEMNITDFATVSYDAERGLILTQALKRTQ